jgi:hypothetical protein
VGYFDYRYIEFLIDEVLHLEDLLPYRNRQQLLVGECGFEHAVLVGIGMGD